MQVILTIEDCIEHLIAETNLVSTDHIMVSLYKQITIKQLGLTDKQHSLAKDKVLKFRQYIDPHVSDLESVIEETRLPLRSIDREKSITIDHLKNSDFIKIKFPFNKRTMTDLATITVGLNRGTTYIHERGTNEHFIKLSEENIQKVFDVFEKKNFYIDPELVELNKEIREIQLSPEKYLPGVYCDNLVNFPTEVKSLIESDVGELNYYSRILYRDRSLRYGISCFDFELPGHTLSEKIANRVEPEVVISKTHEISDVIKSLIDLKRAPFIVMINDSNKPEEMFSELKCWYNELSKYYSNSEQSVLFRVDNQPSVYTLNDFIKDNQLNNWVDEKTKVVYIKKSRMPNVLVKSPWKPITSLSMTMDTPTTFNTEFAKRHCDLIVYLDEYKNSSNFYYKRSKLNVIV